MCKVMSFFPPPQVWGGGSPPVQSTSSDPSRQSPSPSHLHTAGIHPPSSHCHWSWLHSEICPTKCEEYEQEINVVRQIKTITSSLVVIVLTKSCTIIWHVSGKRCKAVRNRCLIFYLKFLIRKTTFIRLNEYQMKYISAHDSRRTFAWFDLNKYFSAK